MRLSRSRIRARVKRRSSDHVLRGRGSRPTAVWSCSVATSRPSTSPGRFAPRCFATRSFDGDFGAVRMAMLRLIGLLVIGGFEVGPTWPSWGHDPILLRFAGLPPRCRRTGRWCAGSRAFTPPLLERLAMLLRDLVLRARSSVAGWPELTIDLDGTVLRTGAKVDGRRAGLQPGRPPEGSLVLSADRPPGSGSARSCVCGTAPGNVHDSHNAAGFLRQVSSPTYASRFGHRLPGRAAHGRGLLPPGDLRVPRRRSAWTTRSKVPMWKWLGAAPR